MIAAALLLMQLGSNAGSSWVGQPIGTDTDLHIVRAVDESVAWAAGENGVFARTADGGVTWHANPIYTCTNCPITALTAHGADSAVLTTGGRPARIYVTGDGGRSWSLSFESGQHDVRLAGLAFYDAHRGFAVSDPVEGRFLVLTTTDGGATWTEAPKDLLPAPLAGERIAATSGTGVMTLSDSTALVATGGGSSRVFRTTDSGVTWSVSPVRLTSVQALAFGDANAGIAVGTGHGRANAVRTTDGGRTWGEPFVAGLPGAKEGASYVPGTSARSVVVVGPSGSALSTDGGVTWKAMDRAAAHAVSFAGPVDAGWKVGSGGSVKKLLRGISARRRVTDAAATTSVVAPALGRTAPAPTPKPEGAPAAPGTLTVKPGTKIQN